MKKIVLLLLFITGMTNAQIVNIPDANFKARLITLGIDTNSDGNIQNSEALAVTTLDVSFGGSISDLTGIEAFLNLTSLKCNGLNLFLLNVSALTNLTYLECGRNYPLAALNVSTLTNLTYLDCSQNSLTSLNVSGLTSLTSLKCYENQLTALNVTNLTNLTNLDCWVNQLTTLDITSLVNLTALNCRNNQITVLNVAPLTNLTSLNCNSNQLTALDVTPLLNLTSLGCSYNQITALNVAPLTNLTILDCIRNQLTALDVTPLLNLTSLDCSYNQLTVLDVTPLLNLTSLECSSNQLTVLDVTTLLNLTRLGCSGNQLTTLDVTPLINLTELSCSSNLLISLNVTPLTNLTSLSFGNPQFSSIDVSTLVNLTHFGIYEALLTSIDLSNSSLLNRLTIKNTNLTSLDISNNYRCNDLYFSRNQDLTYLNIKNSTYPMLTIESCPNLIYVCAEENAINLVNNVLASIPGNNPNAQVSSYCSFTPGGAYNTITGTVRFDSNNNGCDAGDLISNNIRIGINDGAVSGATFTNTLGMYSFFVQQPNLTLAPSMENPTYFNISPATATLNFPTNNNTTQTQDFCITANGVHPDVEVVLSPIGQARPGFDANYQLVYKNKGNQTLNGAVNLTFDDARTDFVTALPSIDNQAINSLTWNYTALLPFEVRTINFTLNTNSPVETPAVNDGDILDFTATVNPIAGDETPTDNIFDLHQTVVNSLDPNDKTCLEGNTLTPAKIGDYLHYNINFENTGSADAINIVVKDIIDIAKFDINTLQVMYASHAVKTKITGNIVEFIFEGINLPPSNIDPIGGHANVLFKIKTKSNLVVGDVVSNVANIYFDYNAPIETNIATSTFAVLSNPAFEIDNSVLVYPNPAKNNITISAKSNMKSVQLFDIQGRILQTILEDKNTTNIDISNHQNGVYFLKITTESGTKVEKVVKE